MCFSAEASFTAAAALTICGYATTKLPLDKRYLLIAVTPFLFAVQQFLEGMLWVATKDPVQLEQYGRLEAFGYLFFAILFWPVWIPLSLYVAEIEPIRKKCFLGCLALGSIFCLILVYTGLQGGVNVVDFQIFSHSIHYILPYSPFYQIHPNLSLFIYFLASTASIFISSIRYMWVLGVLGLLGLILALVFYNLTMMSVWCFFAAWCSVTLYFILRKEKRTG